MTFTRKMRAFHVDEIDTWRQHLRYLSIANCVQIEVTHFFTQFVQNKLYKFKKKYLQKRRNPLKNVIIVLVYYINGFMHN